MVIKYGHIARCMKTKPRLFPSIAKRQNGSVLLVAVMVTASCKSTETDERTACEHIAKWSDIPLADPHKRGGRNPAPRGRGRVKPVIKGQENDADDEVTFDTSDIEYRPAITHKIHTAKHIPDILRRLPARNLRY